MLGVRIEPTIPADGQIADSESSAKRRKNNLSKRAFQDICFLKFLIPISRRRQQQIFILLTMDNLAPAHVSQDELPSGFTTAGAGAGAQTADPKAAEKEAQKQSILEQALTPEALARLRRIKVK